MEKQPLSSSCDQPLYFGTQYYRPPTPARED